MKSYRHGNSFWINEDPILRILEPYKEVSPCAAYAFSSFTCRNDKDKVLLELITMLLEHEADLIEKFNDLVLRYGPPPIFIVDKDKEAE